MASPGRSNDKKKKDPKKEDRAAFLARTQAQRESRQHTRQENDAATKIEAMVRRARDLTAARKDLLERLEAAVQAEPVGRDPSVAELLQGLRPEQRRLVQLVVLQGRSLRAVAQGRGAQSCCTLCGRCLRPWSQA